MQRYRLFESRVYGDKNAVTNKKRAKRYKSRAYRSKQLWRMKKKTNVSNCRNGNYSKLTNK